jgi:hypothetical protein
MKKCGGGLKPTAAFLIESRPRRATEAALGLAEATPFRFALAERAGW